MRTAPSLAVVLALSASSKPVNPLLGLFSTKVPASCLMMAPSMMPLPMTGLLN